MFYATEHGYYCSRYQKNEFIRTFHIVNYVKHCNIIRNEKFTTNTIKSFCFAIPLQSTIKYTYYNIKLEKVKQALLNHIPAR